MKAGDAAKLLNAGLERDKVDFAAKKERIAKLCEQLGENEAYLDVVTTAVRIFEDEDRAYRWLTGKVIFLRGKSPVEEMLTGNHELVMQALVNFEHGLPP